MIRVLLAEDEFITRVGIRYCLDNAGGPFQLIGEAADGRQALQMCRELHPDILLTDIRMPEMYGLELIRQLTDPEAVISAVSRLIEEIGAEVQRGPPCAGEFPGRGRGRVYR